MIRFKAIVLGDEGKNVADIQKCLAKAGSALKPTTKFTIAMLSAVKSFQKKNGLPVTGKVDKKTWDALHAVKAPRKGNKK